MMKVLNVTSDHNIGGAGRCILTFLEAYHREEFQVTLVLPKGSALIPYVQATKTPFLEVEGMENQSYSKEAVKALKKVFQAEKPDVVHTHASFSARVAAKLCRIPVVSTRHSVFPNKPSVTKGIGKFVNGMSNNLTANRIIAVAEAAKDNLTEGGVSAKKIVVIKNGVKPLKQFSEEEWMRARQFFGFPTDSFVFGMVARLEDIKGHDYFIEAAKTVSENHPEARFVICGTGAYEKHLKEKVALAGMEQQILFTGYIKDVTAIMNAIDVNVNASYGTEATSLSLLEGMSIGKPIIASNYGGNPELVVPEENGLLFESRNALALSRAMSRLLEDPVLYQALGQGARKLYETKYTARIMTDQIEEIYKQVSRRGN